MVKRKAVQAGIVAAFAKQSAAAAEAALEHRLPPIEAPLRPLPPTVPYTHVEELTKLYEQYSSEEQRLQRQLQASAEGRDRAAARRRRRQPGGSGGATAPSARAQRLQRRQPGGGSPAASGGDGAGGDQGPASDADVDGALDDGEDDDEGEGGDRRAQAVVARWQSKAAHLLRQLGAWAGGAVALPLPLQEQLLHVALNHELHADPSISVAASRLLLTNLAAHPPAAAAAAAAPQQQRQAQPQPAVLHVAPDALCWHPMCAESGGGGGALRDKLGARFPALQALVANAVLAVAGSDNAASPVACASRTARASQGRALALLYVVELLGRDAAARLAVFEQHMRAGEALRGEELATVRRRAGTLLRHSLLLRLMESDTGWSHDANASTGRHRLVRDLLVLVAHAGGAGAGAQAGAKPGSAAAGDDAGAGAEPEQAPPQPVSPGELREAGRRLLVMLLQLYSGCEAAGVYSGARRHAPANDRFWVDAVALRALGGLGGGWALQALRADAAGPAAAAAALRRLLAALPPVHRARLLALAVAEAINARTYDQLGVEQRAHITRLHHYFADEGKGSDTFQRGDPLEAARALADRLEWAGREVLGGGVAFALLACGLISAALGGGGLLQDAEQRREMGEVAGRLLKKLSAGVGGGGGGFSDAGAALAAACQQLAAL